MGDAVSVVTSPQFGDGRDPSTKKEPYILPQGEYISQVEINRTRIDSITFITNKGNKSPRYGGAGGSYKMITFPPGFKMVGISGAEDDSLVGIQFWLSQVHYAPSETPEIMKKQFPIHEE